MNAALARLLPVLVLLSAATGNLGAAPAKVPEKVFRDVTYATHDGNFLKLDLYVPADRQSPPIVLWFHGGGWRYGDKRFNFRIRELTSYGIAVATVQYRLSWSAKWPAQRDDCLAALSWMRAHGKEYGVNPARLGLSGESAGGHLAALLGVLNGKQRIKAVVAMYPPTDMERLAWRYRKDWYFGPVAQLFGGPYEKSRDEAIKASPIHYVSRRSPPFLFIHGDHDILVPVDHSIRMHQQLLKAGAESHLIIMHDYIHGFRLDDDRLKAVAEFFQAHL